MKYIILETADGQKLPILFAEQLVHADVADVMGRLVDRMMPKLLGKRRTYPRSAGFVSFYDDVTVHGKSESLGGLMPLPMDALRITAGPSVARMPDSMLKPLLDKLDERKTVDYETVAVDKGLLQSAINEIRAWKVDKGGDDQVVLNLEATLKLAEEAR